STKPSSKSRRISERPRNYGVPQNILTTWLKTKEQIKVKYLAGDVESEGKKACGAKYPRVETALLNCFQNARGKMPLSMAS
ncbi:hypothetical protein MAR_004308, partial [Mya arenaria]